MLAEIWIGRRKVVKVLMVEQGEGEGEGEVFRDEEVGGIVEWYTRYSHLSSMIMRISTWRR